MAFNRSQEIQDQLEAYAENSGDTPLRISFGQPGSRVEYLNETYETGQAYTTPSFLMGLLTSVGTVIGSWEKEDFDIVAAGSVTLAEEPANAAALMVYHDGVLMRKVSSPSSSNEYGWTSGKTLTFGSPLTGWISAYYLATV
jgi:hypothetical protein